MNSSIKFRPSLSAAQISHILFLLQDNNNSMIGTQLNNDTIKALKVFKLKAEHGIVTPSHVSIGKPSIEQSLGFSDIVDSSIDALLEIYNSTPNILSESQLSRVQKHRYVNDLMTTEEETEYEQSQ